MSHTAGHRLDHLPPAASRLGAAFARPKRLAIACIVVLTGLGWLYLGLLAADMDSVTGTICSPTFGVALMPNGVWGTSGFGLVGLMWAAMTLAMMLPSAAPMILTYAEIADTAASKSTEVVSPFVLAAGYTAVWFGFSAAATLAQYTLTRAALLDARMASVSALFSGAILIGAGLYQFSPFKHACLKQCQLPFPFFFANWQTTARGVFRLGVQQGLFCLGCCWAMMMVMFVVGMMNIIWMAGLGILMTIEKLGAGRRFTQAIGVLSIVAGLWFVGAAVLAHWPGRPI